MYTKDKTIRLTIRLDKKSSDYVNEHSKEMGLTPSAFVRQMIYNQMFASNAITNTIQHLLESTAKASINENNQTNINNLI